MKNFFTGLVVLFVLATQKEKLRELNKSFEKSPEPELTREQHDAIEEIKAMYKQTYPESEDRLEGLSFSSPIRKAEIDIGGLNIHYQAEIAVAETDLRTLTGLSLMAEENPEIALSADKAYERGYFEIGHLYEDLNRLGSKLADDFCESFDMPTENECLDRISDAKRNILRLRELCTILELNFDDIVRPNRDKALHKQFSLD